MAHPVFPKKASEMTTLGKHTTVALLYASLTVDRNKNMAVERQGLASRSRKSVVTRTGKLMELGKYCYLGFNR